MDFFVHAGDEPQWWAVLFTVKGNESQKAELLKLQPVQDVLSFTGNNVITELTTSLSQSLESKLLTKQAHQQTSPIQMSEILYSNWDNT